jgi:hypothetical protein
VADGRRDRRSRHGDGRRRGGVELALDLGAVLVEERGPAIERPRRVRHPLAADVRHRPAELGVLDVAEGAARLPVLVGHVLVGAPQRHEDEPGLLRLPPRGRVVGELAEQALHDLEGVGCLLRVDAAARARDLSGARRPGGRGPGRGGLGEVAGHAVALEERHQVGPVAGPDEGQAEPAAVLGLHDARHQ